LKTACLISAIEMEFEWKCVLEASNKQGGGNIIIDYGLSLPPYKIYFLHTVHT